MNRSLSWQEMQGKAIKFADKWKDAEKEESEPQPFTLDFIKIFVFDDPIKVG